MIKPILLPTLLLTTILLAACSPKVEVVAPDKPITINLNIKIDHEVRVKVEKDLDKVISEDSELF
jgi:lipoprotein NlpI